MLKSLLILSSLWIAPAMANSMTDPVTPRDVRWYMANPQAQQATLQVCHSNAAYMTAPDCANAEAAGAAIMGNQYRQHASSNSLYNPAYWSLPQNRMSRDGIIAQCVRNGPGDAMVRPFCHAAGLSQLNDIRGR